jgi:FkbM family methyltransferase
VFSLGFRIPRRLLLSYIERANARRYRAATRRPAKQLRVINGSKMILDPSIDDGLCRYLLIAGRREAYATEVMARELTDARVVVDVGANIGYYALLQAKMLAGRGKVIAVEPVPDAVALLKENIALNGYTNVDVFQTAIGDRNGTARMYVGKWLNRSQLEEVGSISNDLISRAIETPMATLDEFLADKPPPDIIRMDVEGYEYNILKGMERTLGKGLPLRIFVEFHFRFMGREKSEHLLRMLKTYGFEIGALTFEVDEKCITRSQLVENIAAYLNSKVTDVPPKGHLAWTIDDILSDAPVWKGEKAWDMCMRVGALEIMFKRPAGRGPLVRST